MKIDRKVLRNERAIVEFCRSRKWDPNNLTPHQLAQIVELVRAHIGRPSEKAYRSA